MMSTLLPALTPFRHLGAAFLLTVFTAIASAQISIGNFAYAETSLQLTFVGAYYDDGTDGSYDFEIQIDAPWSDQNVDGYLAPTTSFLLNGSAPDFENAEEPFYLQAGDVLSLSMMASSSAGPGETMREVVDATIPLYGYLYPSVESEYLTLVFKYDWTYDAEIYSEAPYPEGRAFAFFDASAEATGDAGSYTYYSPDDFILENWGTPAGVLSELHWSGSDEFLYFPFSADPGLGDGYFDIYLTAMLESESALSDSIVAVPEASVFPILLGIVIMVPVVLRRR